QRAWLCRLDTLEHEVDGLQEEAGVLENEWQKAAALRARYADATRAAALEPLHARLSTLRSQQQGDQAQLQLHDVEHQQSRRQTESFNEALAQAQRQHVQVQQTRSRALPVIRQARSLDQQVQRARQTLDHENERLAERVRARDQHRAELGKRILSRESQASQLTAARAYLDQHAHDAYLGKALAGVAMQRESLLAIRKKMSQITADIATAEAALKRARASLDAQKAARQENERSRDQMQAALARQAQALATLLNGRLLRELHNEKDGLLRERLLLKKIHNLHEE